jgi:hypothetical protein
MSLQVSVQVQADSGGKFSVTKCGGIHNFHLGLSSIELCSNAMASSHRPVLALIT